MTEESKESQSTRHLAMRLWRDYLRHHLGRVIAASLCMVLVAVTTGAQVQLVQPALDELLVEGNESLLWMLPLAFVGIVVVRGAASYGQAILMAGLALEVIRKIQVQMFERVVGADLAYIDKSPTGTLISRFISDVFVMRNALTNSFTGLIRDGLTTVALIGVMFYTNWRMSLVTFIVFPVAGLFITRLGQRMRRVVRATQVEYGQLTSGLDNVLKGIRQVKAYGMERHETTRVIDLFQTLKGLYYKAAKTQARAVPTLEALGGLVFAGILFYGGYQAQQGQITVGAFMAFFAAMLMAYQPIRRIANLNVSLQQGLAASERVFEIVDYRRSIEEAPDARPLTVSDGHVRLEGVDFSYGDDIPTLIDVTMDAPPGKVIALVGPSGAGKSTVLNLIPRFYDVAKGAVTIDGQDIRAATLDSVRASIGLVSQDTMLFDDTVRANIAYGRPDASEDEIVAAAKGAVADEFIRQLPNGYDTVVGERGVILSGGQRQRLSIARAMLKNAPILLLDEATSALDTESERSVQAALKHLMTGRTTIVIAHRLSTIVDADIIYVFDRGRIVEVGSHADLSAGNGLYARLSQMQFSEEDSPTSLAEKAE
ncbi:MAG: ABC transporter transmembrane domain-containing protein [Alphaproteobacteria bacterium]|nr:ABC transporter transmembrane domain-containing protein [Alphaproteobacteria bacterium]